MKACFLSAPSGSHPVSISVECHTKKSMNDSSKCFDLSFPPDQPKGSEVMTSNNVAVALTANEDMEGVGFRTGSSYNAIAMETDKHSQIVSKVAHIVLENETEEGRRDGEDKEPLFKTRFGDCGGHYLEVVPKSQSNSTGIGMRPPDCKLSTVNPRDLRSIPPPHAPNCSRIDSYTV